MKAANQKFNLKGWFSFVLIIVLAGTGVFFKVSKSGDMPKPDGKELWMYIMEKHSYTNWEHWPGMEEMYEGQSPHGAFLKLYVNDIAKMAISKGEKVMPQHAIIVKENYNEEKKLVAITPMYKVEGYNPEAGNWFWAKYGPDGKIMAEGKVKGCIKCHGEVKGDDYLFTMSK